MTADRRLRLLRLRVVGHRLAAAELARADAARANVAAVERRVAALREATATVEGATSGRALQSRAELAQRLDRAHGDLELSRADADTLCHAREAGRRRAHRDEQRARRLHADALARENDASERRADARRIWRKRNRVLPC